MPVVRYTAKRSLIAGVSENDTVTLDLLIRYAGLTPSRAPQVSQRRSLSGFREAYYYRADVTWQCSTRPLTATEAAAHRMFLDSVESGDLFEFDPDASSGDSPINWQNVVLELNGYSAAPEQNLQSRAPYTFTISAHP